MFDVVTLGETMLRFTPPDFCRLGQTTSMEIHVGGSESNTAIGLSRLGRKVAWLSSLTNNPLGRHIDSQIRVHGVDTSHVHWTDKHRVGLYFLEPGSPPRNSQVIYDRAESAFSHYSTDMLPKDLFRPGAARWLHVSGISLGVSEVARQTVRHAVELAKQAGWSLSFDVNYRSLLWSPEVARVELSELFRTADLLFTAARDLKTLWGLAVSEGEASSFDQLVAVREGKPSVVTLGSFGAAACSAAGVVLQPITPVAPIGRLGGGDAFSAGFLHSWLSSDDLGAALRWATTVARFKYSIPGDIPWIERSEIEKSLQSLERTPDVVR